MDGRFSASRTGGYAKNVGDAMMGESGDRWE